MERKFFVMIGALLGVALVLATATVYTQSALAVAKGGSGKGGNGAVFSVGGASGGHEQGPPGCTHPIKSPQNNPNCP